MVGFERRMAENQVPEWSTEYLPYAKMKKLLKELVARVGEEEAAAARESAAAAARESAAERASESSRSDAAPSGASPSRGRRASSSAARLSASPLRIRTHASVFEDSHVGRKRGELIAVRTRDAAMDAEESVAFLGDDADDDDVADPHHHHLDAPTTADTASPASSSTTSVPLTTRIIAEPDSDAVFGLEDERRFFFALDESLRRIVAFYGDRLAHLRDESAKEKNQLSHLRSETRRVVEEAREARNAERARARAVQAAWRSTSSGSFGGGEDVRSTKRIAANLLSGVGAAIVPPHGSALARQVAVDKTRDDARLLRRAVSESYRGVNMLESYVSLNMEAFRKIVKKHDKLTGWQTQETYMRGLRELRIFHDDETRAIRAHLENAYLKIEEVLCALEPDRWRKAATGYEKGASDLSAPGFYEVRRRRNALLAKLRQDGRAGLASHASTRRERSRPFVAGLALGAAIALGAMLATRVSEACSSDAPTGSCDAVARAAPAIRFPLLVALHAGLYGVLVRAWSDTRVNAPFIFGAKRGTELTATGAVLAGSLAACAWFVVTMVLVSRASAENPENDVSTRWNVSALVGAVVGAVVFLAPWPKYALRRVFGLDVERRLERGLAEPFMHPPDSTRRFFLGALRRGVAAPFHRVTMIDFFLMDQIVSQTAALRDATTVALRALFPSMARHAPLVALLPGWLRLLQCLRRRRDDGQRVHLVNAGKYLVGLVATSFGLVVWYKETAGRIQDDGVLGGHVVRDPSAWRLLYNATTYLAVAYGAFWDFFMDWSVFSVVERRSTDRDQTDRAPRSRDRSLFRSLREYRVVAFRRRLMIRERWKYHVAIAFNLATRNAWILASVPLAGGAVGDEVWITVYAAIEVCRRCYWSYFRVENEHTTNCGKFRATVEIPLPFRDGELTDDDDEDRDEREYDASRRGGSVGIDASGTSRRRSSSGSLVDVELGRRRSGSVSDADGSRRRGDAFGGEADALASDLFERQIASSDDDDSDDERARPFRFDDDHSDTDAETGDVEMGAVAGAGAGATTGGQDQGGAGISRRSSIEVDIPITRRGSVSSEMGDAAAGAGAGAAALTPQRSVGLEAIARLVAEQGGDRGSDADGFGARSARRTL